MERSKLRKYDLFLLCISPSDPHYRIRFDAMPVSSSLQILEELKGPYDVIVEAVPTAILIVDRNGSIIIANKRAVELFGYTEQEFLSLTVEDLVPPSIRKVHRKYRESFENSPEIRPMGEQKLLVGVRKDGTEFPADVGLAPLPGRHSDLTLASILDISKRKQAENNLQEHARLLELHAIILENVYDAVFYVDSEWKVVQWNLGAERIFGITPGEAIGEKLDSLMPLEGITLSRLLPIPSKSQFEEDEVHLNRKDGNEVFLRVRASRLGKNGIEGTIFCAIDITRQRKTEAELTRVAEEEQRRIGRDIHDDLCSQLSGIGCLIKALETQFQEAHRAEASLMASISEMVAAAGVKAREIAQGLNPEGLLEQGLPEAIRDLVEQNRNIYHVECLLTIEGAQILDSLERENATQLFRISQEAMTNAIRHSSADSMELSLIADETKISLTVHDNGKGIQENLISAGMGLSTMRRRAELIGASFDIHTSPGAGTTVRCDLMR